MIGRDGYMILHNFIVFEGIDGSGTSTQMDFLQTKLADKNVCFTYEPTELETGKFLRKILKGDIQLHPDTIARLFAADRCEHLYGKNGIIEKAGKGSLVLSDRYIFSSLAYQSNECGENLPRQLNANFPLPEIVFYFDIEPSVSINRIQGRRVTEIYEKKDFLEQTRRQYLSIMKEYEKQTSIIYIDAAQSKADVSEKIWSIISKLPMIKA